ncbi:MAG: winged helix-turn-helix transcriptional regulator [Myxococcota bacterium]
MLGSRWTLLIVRELLIAPRRFSELHRPLPGISTSVLSDRLAGLERKGIVRRRELPPPTSATVYELTPAGRDLLPAVIELSRWGLRYLEAPRPDDHVDPGWIWIGLVCFARRGASPARTVNVTVPDEGRDHCFTVVGGSQGTSVRNELSDADVSITAPTPVVLGLASGGLDPEEAIRSGALRAEGNLAALADFPSLFDIQPRESQGA